MRHIINGDGSFQKLLDAGQCPKCKNKLEEYHAVTFTDLVSNGKERHVLFCSVCKLEVLDSSAWSDKIRHGSEQSQETEMHETYLMPSEQDFCTTPEKIQWSEAVNTIENLIENWLSDPEPVSEELEAKVRQSWQRILAG